MSGNLGSPEGMIYEDHFDAHNQPRKVPSADSFAAHLDSKQNLDPQHQKSNISLDPKMGRAFRDSDVNGTIAAFPQIPDSGFVFLLENPSLDLMNWDLPGAFKADEMDMDQSPGFDNGMFVDSNSGLPESAKQEDGSLMHFIKEDDNLGLRFITDSAKRDESNSDFVPGLLDGKPQHNFSMSQLSTISNHSSIPTNFDDRAAAHFDLDHGSVSNDYGELGTKRFDGDNRSPTGINPATAFGNQVSSHEFQHEQRAMDSLGVQYHTPETEVPNHPRSRRNTQSHRASFLAVNADFLPLTTTTSLTPSMNSMYSAQASFFSANQFNRSLFDQPPSLIHRPSFDIYPRGRVSLDSQGSSVNPPSRNPRSFSSYIPFMGERDRERKQRSLPEWDQQHQQQQQQQQHVAHQSRHLIRSIFKSNNEPPGEEPAPFLADVLVDPDADDSNFANPEDNPVPAKKAKRTRMNLFNRFKTGKNQPLESQHELVKHESHSSVASSERDDSSHQNSIVQHSLQNSVKTGNSSNLGNVQISDSQPPQEPDYASLFENMGKRRLGGMKNKKPVKQESDSNITSSVSATEKSSLNQLNRLSNEHSADSRLARSISLSQHSSLTEESHAAGPTPSLSSFASASKRILGLRLLKKKAQQSKDSAQSDVVEIDLESLDLPPDTEIIPTNPKGRTRGRKEDKAADLVDLSKIFVCTYCLRRFKRQEHLKRHFRSLHTAEKPYECPKCLKKFSRTDNLNQHLKVHKQEEEEEAARAVGRTITKEEDEM